MKTIERRNCSSRRDSNVCSSYQWARGSVQCRYPSFAEGFISAIKSYIESTWPRIRREVEPRYRFLLSPAEACVDEAIRSALAQHCRGMVLDAGAGEMPYRELIEQRATYVGVDQSPRATDVAKGDVQDLGMFESNSFQMVLCSEVLEHVKDPTRACQEFSRVLQPGGVLIMTVPFLARLHEEPNDYFRFTSHGVRHILESTSFDTIEVRPLGGVVSFLIHQAATVTLSLAWRMGLIRQALLFFMGRVVTPLSLWIDGRLPTQNLMPLGYLATAIASEQ